jgi:hypothetical protein
LVEGAVMSNAFWVSGRHGLRGHCIVGGSNIFFILTIFLIITFETVRRIMTVTIR